MSSRKISPSPERARPGRRNVETPANEGLYPLPTNKFPPPSRLEFEYLIFSEY